MKKRVITRQQLEAELQVGTVDMNGIELADAEVPDLDASETGRPPAKRRDRARA